MTKNDIRIADAFTGGKAFIPFVTCGDPDLATTEELVVSMAHASADLIELGIPFSDPTAEGPVIQAASARALAEGITTDDIFAMAERIRARIDTPLVFMTYANVVFKYGTDRFFSEMARVGVQGIILPDVPFEEKHCFAPNARAHGIEFISMVAPTSAERIAMIAGAAEGFIYVVSSMGVTGEHAGFASNLAQTVEHIRAATSLPCAIGFGVSEPEQAREMCRIADGVIVGSAIVKRCGEFGKDCVAPVTNYVAEMKQAALSAAE